MEKKKGIHVNLDYCVPNTCHLLIISHHRYIKLVTLHRLHAIKNYLFKINKKIPIV